jgi:hypothetical protein
MDERDGPDEALPADPEKPEADALDQEREVAPSEHRGPVSRTIDTSDADAIEQAIEVPLDEDEDEDEDDPDRGHAAE